MSYRLFGSVSSRFTFKAFKQTYQKSGLFRVYESYKALMLFSSVVMFIFSFSAGFGAVYFQELLGKSFTKEYRGKVLAARQFASGFAGILSGGISAYFLTNFSKPDSFAYLFMVSGLIMAFSFSFMLFFKENPKVNVSQKEKKFGEFIKNSTSLLKTDKYLRLQALH